MSEPLLNGEERARNGQFLPGHPGGPGRPKTPSYGELLKTKLSTERALGLFEKLIKYAEDGEAWAFQQLLPYILGKPKETIDIHGNIGHYILRLTLDERDDNRLAPPAALPETEGGDLRD